MRWELLFCHSFWNDIKIQMPSMAMECEGFAVRRAAPRCTCLRSIASLSFRTAGENTAKFAFGENGKFTTLINVPFICSPACHFPGAGQHRAAVTGSFTARHRVAKNCTREVSKLLGRQVDVIEQRNKKPCPYDGVLFFFSFFPPDG